MGDVDVDGLIAEAFETWVHQVYHLWAIKGYWEYLDMHRDRCGRWM